MKITLKNVKTYEDMSEETLAFSATVYVDGKKAGTASNHGCGGCNEYHGFSRELFDTLDEYCHNLPLIQLPDDAEPFMRELFPMKQDLDQVIYDLVMEYKTKAWEKRQCSKKTLFRKPNETYETGEWNTVKAPFSLEVQSYLVKKYGSDVMILNENLT